MKIKMINRIVIILLLLISNLYGTEIENIYGKYHYVDNDIAIEFSLNNNGITEFKLDNSNYSKTLSYDHIGIYGNTFILEVKIEVDEKRTIVLDIFVVADSKKIHTNSCLFFEMKNKDDVEFSVIRQKNLSFNIKKCAYE